LIQICETDQLSHDRGIIATNGRVLTMDEAAPRAQALVSRGREIAYVRNAREAVTYQG
jgi:predicted amidohydrolase YtcJ